MKKAGQWLALGFVLCWFAVGMAEENPLPPGVIKYDQFDSVSNPYGQSLKIS